MAKFIRLPAQQTVTTLCARLRPLEGAESPDEAVMNAIAKAEQALLAALAGTRSSTLSEAGQKLATVTGRGAATAGFFSEANLAVLRSVLDDLRCFGTAAAVA